MTTREAVHARADEIAAGMNLVQLKATCPNFYREILRSTGPAKIARYIAAYRASLRRTYLSKGERFFAPTKGKNP